MVLLSASKPKVPSLIFLKLIGKMYDEVGSGCSIAVGLVSKRGQLQELTKEIASTMLLLVLLRGSTYIQSWCSITSTMAATLILASNKQQIRKGQPQESSFSFKSLKGNIILFMWHDMNKRAEYEAINWRFHKQVVYILEEQSRLRSFALSPHRTQPARSSDLAP
ncbi:hypothetical protein MUK42_33781 [Musa troglodytarum]|uniref:Uncharacterized protein n=1 Tax=Musa troglodytarum TaxID=320322 RepID=A0A9E7GNQ2_9LILI|nr:hypothetical protein MUK42_33781 [Musa troglodytarum]